MRLTRRRALTTAGAALLGSATAPAAAERSGRPVTARTDEDERFQLDWELREERDRGWWYSSGTPTEDGVTVAVSLLTDYRIGTATRVLEISADGEIAELGVVGDVDDPDERYIANGIVRSPDGGYVLAGQYFADHGPDGADGRVTKIDADGTTEWTTYLETGSDISSVPDEIVATDEGYLIALDPILGHGSSGLASVDRDGEVQWTREEVEETTYSTQPMALARDGDEFVLLSDGVTGTGEPPRVPLLTRLNETGEPLRTVELDLDGGRFAADMTSADGSILLCGAATDENGDVIDEPWYCELDGTVEQPTRSGTIDQFDGRFIGVDYDPEHQWPVFTGRVEGGRAVAGRRMGDGIEWWTSGNEDGTYVDVVPGEESVYALGRIGTETDAELVAGRVTASILPSDVDLDVPDDPVPIGEDVQFSAESAYTDLEAFDSSWTLDGELIGSGPSTTATLEESGEYDLSYSVRTNDDESLVLEQSLVVEDEDGSDAESDGSSDGDALPGFGVGVAGASIVAGGLLAHRLRCDGANDEN